MDIKNKGRRRVFCWMCKRHRYAKYCWRGFMSKGDGWFALQHWYCRKNCEYFANYKYNN